ncbi:hypothetical protein K461DRAFT_292340 [Myriangium duriaei CBS 260.36]|uniref:Uncharacterized protein n=1 Tax=Myriangium duriaei CBS 260.36 TaxID=1168546 RepID=A0A9P4MJN0_9PEZI|nr:hypothetical protein K461DRAFT_292340 [Myriangium duriaei CBS 260.36]
MVVLTYYVDGRTSGKCGIREPLSERETFGSWSAATCVILLIKLADKTLFCGHMSCGWKGNETTKAKVAEAVKELLIKSVTAENQGCSWAYTTGGGDITSKWMRDAMIAWFKRTPDKVSNTDLTDGYFNGDGNFEVSGKVTNGSYQVNDGAFHIGPLH